MNRSIPSASLPTVGLFCDSDSRGGVFSYTRLLGTELRRQGCRVEIVTLAPRDAAATANVEALAAAADRLICLPGQATPDQRVGQLRRTLIDRGWDVFFPNYRYTTYAACAARPADGPTRVVGVCHNDHESYYRLLGYYRTTIDGFVGPSQKTCRELARLWPSRADDVAHLPHGVEVGTGPAPAYTGGPLRLVYHGRLTEEQKSVSSLIELAVELDQRQVDFTLTLIGDADGTVDYRRLAAARGVAHRVEVRGSLPREQLLAELRSYHLAVLTSRYEGFCLSLAEALALGLPAAAFSTGGVIEEFLHDGVNGVIVPWGQTEDLAQRIAGIAADPALWQRWSAAAQAGAAERFSPAAFGRRYLEFLGELCQRPAIRHWPRWRPVLAEPHRPGVKRVVDRVGERLKLWS